MSLAYIPVTMTGMGGAAPQDAGLASGLINATYQVGSALGLAAMVSVAAAAADGETGADAMLDSYRAAFAGAAIIAAAAAVVAAIWTRRSAAPKDVPVG